MCAPSSPAVRPFAGGVPRRTGATASSDASVHASGKKRPRDSSARDSSAACLAKTARGRSSVVTSAGMEVVTVGEMPVPGDPAQERLKKRLASELDALRGLLKKAELISRSCGASTGGGVPTAGKKEQFLASFNQKQRPKPIEDGGGNAPSAKRRKIPTPVEQKQEQKPAPRMSAEERNQIAGRLSSLSGEVPGHIVKFLQKQFGDADSHGEIEINMDTVQDSVLFELKTLLDKFAKENKHGKVAEKSKGEVVPKQEQEHVDGRGVCPIIETGKKPSSSNSGDSGECAHRSAEVLPEQTVATAAQPPSEPAQVVVQQSTQAKKLQDVQPAAPKAVSMRAMIYRANLRRQLLEMERAPRVLPDQSIPRHELQRLGIAEYGNPSVMRQIGLVLKADA